MKKIIQAIIGIMAVLVLDSCIYSNVRSPGPMNSAAHFQLDTGDFKILGTVEAEGTIVTIMGLVAYGGDGYSVLYEKAKKLGGDEIMNYAFDLEGYSILTFVYNRGTWKARATAIKYRDKAMQ